MEIESAECECCGLKEDCTHNYLIRVKSNFGGIWLCGLCSESVRDEACKTGMKDIKEAVRAHMSFCGKFNENPAIRVAEGMRQLLRSASSKRFERSISSS
ncbi:hypothetical protein LUZ60_006656 [Juncus effusus]|nr:hypothetical protein LUZ60_006656 [Juncus effusus]